MNKEINPTKHTTKTSKDAVKTDANAVKISEDAVKTDKDAPKTGEDASSKVTLSPKELGLKGEEAAMRFLERKGFEILEQNWTCFAGEADIIALDGSTVCFIEVKTRRGISKGFPAEAVDAKKRARYEKIAACYLQDYGKTDVFVRFDIISILVLGPSHAFLRMHTNAFCFDS